MRAEDAETDLFDDGLDDSIEGVLHNPVGNSQQRTEKGTKNPNLVRHQLLQRQILKLNARVQTMQGSVEGAYSLIAEERAIRQRRELVFFLMGLGALLIGALLLITS
jgi:hypothetical protein